MVPKNSANTANRLIFLDNLKTMIIFLVVLYHAGWVYEQSGILSSVWIVDDPSKNGLAGIVNLITDIFMMPVMFFISGYFSVLSINTRNGWDYLKLRFKRLMVPWILAVLILIPLYKVIFLYSRNLPQQDLISYFHFTGGSLINQGWLWFLPVLFLFDIGYFILYRVCPARLKINLKGAVLILFVTGIVYSFGMSFFHYSGWTKTILLDFQNERLLIYFMTFILGALCYQLKIFSTLPSGRKRYYVICSFAWIPMNLYIIFLINLFFNPGHYLISRIVDLLMVWSGFHLSLLGLMYIVINTFRYYLNREFKILKPLNHCAYGVYIIHFVVMGPIALLLVHVNLPSMVKYAILTLSTFAASSLIVHFYKTGIDRLKNRHHRLKAH